MYLLDAKLNMSTTQHYQSKTFTLGWQLPLVMPESIYPYANGPSKKPRLAQVMPDYPLVTLYYLFLRGNVVTQIQVMVNK